MANNSSRWTTALVLNLLTLALPATLFGQTSDELPFELRDGHMIVVRGSLPGLDRNVNMLIDTGATATVVNRKLAKRVGLRTLPDMGIKLSAFGSGMKVERVLVRDLRLGRRVITRSCLASDLPWKDIDIVVGVDILRRTALTIDYESLKLVFGATSISQAAVALEDTEGLLVVQVMMNGQTIRLAVDTGAHLTAVYQKSVESWGKRVIGEKRVKVAHSGGFVQARQVTLSSLEIGGTGISRPTVAILETENANSRIDGFLGTASLGLKRIHFDFQGQALSVE
ncbi:MAG: hypothetical protein EHM23_01765 [Acidobacteria bacterium]|nr:MAG: hypothetical protein EHM23_17135 [Acidobacteriota bacterium]RPJ63479.1 MAG: hypothetical protein EHM23_01765 [Acidobacteriota bacterium]